MSGSVEIDTHQFDSVIGQISGLTGKSFETIIKYEAARILEKSLEFTRSANAKLIDERYTYRDDSRPNKRLVTYAYLNGRRRIVRKIRKKGAMVLRGRGSKRKEVWDPNATNKDWKPLQAELKRLKDWKKARRGMSKASWLYIAKRAKLGRIKGSSTKYVVKSLALMSSTMKRHLNATSKGSFLFTLELKNYAKVPMIKAGGKRDGAGGYEAFTKAFHGRSGYFYKNLSMGVFDSVKKVTSKYKGFELTPLQSPKQSDPVA